MGTNVQIGLRWLILSPLRTLIAKERALTGWLNHMLEKQRGRKTLREMQDWQLQDIGIERDRADEEAFRRFWL